MVMGWIPGLAFVPTVTVIVDVPEPGAAMGSGLKVILSALLNSPADKVIAELKPLSAAVVIVEVPE